LITGTDIQGTVNQLIDLSAVPRNRLEARNATLARQQEGVSRLTASVIAVQLSGDRLAESSLFQTRKNNSSNADAVSVSSAQGAPLGEYTIHTQQLAATHGTTARQRFDSSDQALGLTGKIELRSGGNLQHSLSLSQLNDGLGVQKGSIRITDRSGSTADIDLSNARNMEEVLAAINDNAAINVRASADRDGITLTDLTGETVSNLRVDEVGDGETAADLGLYGINVSSNTAVGQDLTLADPVAFGGNTLASRGAGLSESEDLRITFADGTSLDVDLKVDEADPETFDDLVAALNVADPTRLSAAISDTGNSIVVTDLTSGTDDFTIADINGSTLADTLGLAGTGVDGALETPREEQYLFGVGLEQLAGGKGLGELTSLDITLRDGSAATVDVSAADTVQQVIEAINNSGLDLVAKLDDSRTGIRLRDLSAGTTNNFTVSSGDDTATKLGIATDSTDTIVDGAHLGKPSVDRATRLSDLNQGFGITLGSFRLRDSAGVGSAINLKTAGVETVGQLIDEINGLGIGVQASLNPNGDGIALIDTAEGADTMTITNVGDAVAASQLGLAGTATTQTIDGAEVSAIIGGEFLSIDVAAEDSLQAIVEKINASERFVKASISSDEDGKFALRLNSRQGGQQGQFSVDTIGFSLATETTSRGQDAQLSLTDSSGATRRLTSIDGVFEDEATGLNLTLKELSADPISVGVTENPEAVVNAVKTFVTQFNLLNDSLKSLTFFDSEAQEVGLLFGSTEALRIESGYSRLLSGVIGGNGEIRSLGEVGLRLNDTGKLELDEEKLTKLLEENGQAVEQFFTTEETGVAARLNSLADRLAGVDNGMLLSRGNALTSRIERNNEQIDRLNTRLEGERERLLKQFFNMESAIARLQSNSQAISSIQPLNFSPQ